LPDPVAMEIEPLKYPRILGVNTTANWQVAAAARVPPHGLLPVPETDQSVLAVNARVSDPPEVLVAVTVLGKLENPSAGLSNNRLAGLNDKGRADPPVPVPLRLVICGMKLEPLTINDPLIAPLCVGLSETETVHFDSAASVPLQGAVPEPTAL
jgi:hypothetical protein